MEIRSFVHLSLSHYLTNYMFSIHGDTFLCASISIALSN